MFVPDVALFGVLVPVVVFDVLTAEGAVTGFELGVPPADGFVAFADVDVFDVAGEPV